MGTVRALMFDFNGTLSHDEPLLLRDLPASSSRGTGRPLTEEQYYGRLAGLSEEAIIGGWLGVDGPAARVARGRADRALRRRGGRRLDGDRAGARGRPPRGRARPGGDRLRRLPGRDRAGRRGCRARTASSRRSSPPTTSSTASRIPRGTCSRSTRLGVEAAEAVALRGHRGRGSHRRRPPGSAASPSAAPCPTTASRGPTSSSIGSTSPSSGGSSARATDP